MGVRRWELYWAEDFLAIIYNIKMGGKNILGMPRIYFVVLVGVAVIVFVMNKKESPPPPPYFGGVN